MILTNVCQLADVYYIADHQIDLNQRYVSLSDRIYTDGKASHHVDKEGYIIIESLINASYIVFIDKSGDVCLWVYKYIPDTMYKTIMDHLNLLRSQTGIGKHAVVFHDDEVDGIDTTISEGIPAAFPMEVSNKPKQQYIQQDKNYNRNNDEYLKQAPADIVDVNNFICTECGDLIDRNISMNIDSSINCTCNHCGTVFKLIPSKYYIIKSKVINNNLGSNGIPEYMINFNKVNSEEEEDESQD